jgi:hypothetical protein
MPLDAWIEKATVAGFFAYRLRNCDRQIATWFLAAEKDNAIVTKWYEESKQYWLTERSLPIGDSDEMKQLLIDPQIAVSPEGLKISKQYPYYWVHYLFDRLCNLQPNTKQQWDAVPTIFALKALNPLQQGQAFKSGSKDLFVDRMLEANIGVKKLNHRLNYPDGVLDMIRNEIEQRYNDSNAAVKKIYLSLRSKNT